MYRLQAGIRGELGWKRVETLSYLNAVDSTDEALNMAACSDGSLEYCLQCGDTRTVKQRVFDKLKMFNCAVFCTTPVHTIEQTSSP